MAKFYLLKYDINLRLFLGVLRRVSVWMSVLTGGAVDTVSSRLTVLACGAMETLVATALPVAIVTVLTLPVIGAPAANFPRAFKALVAVVTRATGVILQDGSSVSLVYFIIIIF